MKLPSRLGAIALLCAIAFPATAVLSAPSKTGKAAKPVPGKKAKRKPGAMTAADSAHADSLRRADSTTRLAPVRRIDSLRRADSLRADSLSRASALRAADSTASRDRDRTADSLRRIDSTRRADSVSLAARTWFVARPRDFSQTPGFAVQLQRRLSTELWRSRRAVGARGWDTSTTFEGTWKAARASGAGRMVYAAVYAGTDDRRAAIAWVFDLTDGRKLDSAKAEISSRSPRAAALLARALISPLRPTAADSSCRADSLVLARRAWTVAPIRDWTGKDSIASAVRDSLSAGIQRSSRATWRVPGLSDSCRKRHCVDSAAAAAGIERALHTVLSRGPDSSWILSAWVARTSDDSTLDSLRVVDTDPARLASRLLPELLPGPACGGAECGSRQSRDLWTFRLSGDFGSKTWLPPLLPALKAAFQARGDRQFLPLPDETALGSDSAAIDAAARALGARKLLWAQISTDSGGRTLRAVVRDLVDGSTDTASFRRGGKPGRVVPWMARHAAELLSRTRPACDDACHLDSIRQARTTWTAVGDPASDPVATSVLVDRISDAFLQRSAGRLVSLADPLPCRWESCIDSLSLLRRVDRELWGSAYREPDSSWTAILRTRDVDALDWTDSVTIRDTGSPVEALGRMAVRGLEQLVPRPRPCDSCASTDTIEAGLAFATPAWNGAPDSVRTAFADSLARILAAEGDLQILRAGVDSALAGDSTGATARVRCRTGASRLLVSSAVLGDHGWKIEARLVDLATGRTTTSLSVADKSSWAGRPAEMAPWIARRLLGTDTTAAPPATRHGLEIPWGKILLLGIPLLAGAISVGYHW